MTQATDKQISYARKLGIENPENYTKEALSKMIDEKTGNKPKSSYNGSNAQKQEISRHDVVINRTEKPHSFEFGPANKRLKIYFSDVPDLMNQLKVLENAGLIMEADYKYQAPIEKPGEPTF